MIRGSPCRLRIDPAKIARTCEPADGKRDGDEAQPRWPWLWLFWIIESEVVVYELRPKAISCIRLSRSGEQPVDNHSGPLCHSASGAIRSQKSIAAVTSSKLVSLMSRSPALGSPARTVNHRSSWSGRISRPVPSFRQA
jgi:hypothetical protein